MLTDGQKSAIRFADAFLANDAGSASLLDGFDAAQCFELCIGLALFHAFSKVMIVLGLEPEPGSMPVTELATPDTDRPEDSLGAGLERLGTSCVAAAGRYGDLLDLARLRIGQLLGVRDGLRLPCPGREAFLDLVELFVVDVHAVTDDLFATAVNSRNCPLASTR